MSERLVIKITVLLSVHLLTHSVRLGSSGRHLLHHQLVLHLNKVHSRVVGETGGSFLLFGLAFFKAIYSIDCLSVLVIDIHLVRSVFNRHVLI